MIGIITALESGLIGLIRIAKGVFRFDLDESESKIIVPAVKKAGKKMVENSRLKSIIPRVQTHRHIEHYYIRTVFRNGHHLVNACVKFINYCKIKVDGELVLSKDNVISIESEINPLFVHHVVFRNSCESLFVEFYTSGSLVLPKKIKEEAAVLNDKVYDALSYFLRDCSPFEVGHEHFSYKCFKTPYPTSYALEVLKQQKNIEVKRVQMSYDWENYVPYTIFCEIHDEFGHGEYDRIDREDEIVVYEDCIGFHSSLMEYKEQHERFVRIYNMFMFARPFVDVEPIKQDFFIKSFSIDEFPYTKSRLSGMVSEIKYQLRDLGEWIELEDGSFECMVDGKYTDSLNMKVVLDKKVKYTKGKASITLKVYMVEHIGTGAKSNNYSSSFGRDMNNRWHPLMKAVSDAVDYVKETCKVAS